MRFRAPSFQRQADTVSVSVREHLDVVEYFVLTTTELDKHLGVGRSFRNLRLTSCQKKIARMGKITAGMPATAPAVRATRTTGARLSRNHLWGVTNPTHQLSHCL
jgi:hypothetical protein